MVLSSLIFFMIALMLLSTTISQNGGRLVYALDDPYIHMSMAKNFSQYGVWGITKYGFSSSSSSILWTLLLSLVYFLFGISEVSPFVLNFIIGVLVIILVYTILKEYQLPRAYSFCIQMAVILFTPLLALLFCGQEHTLHILIAVAFMYTISNMLASRQKTLKAYMVSMLLALALPMVRYEGLFMVFAASLLLLWRRKPVVALLIAVSSLIPIIIYGIISVSNGWYFLPNPVILKGSVPDFSHWKGVVRFFGYSAYTTLFDNPHILILLVASLLILVLLGDVQTSKAEALKNMNIIFILVTLCHVQFAAMGWFYRYEAYLVALGFIIVGLFLATLEPDKLRGIIGVKRSFETKHLVAISIILMLIASFLVRGAKSLIEIPLATHQRYIEHVLPGLFLREFPNNSPAVVNDIGAISFYSEVKILDMYGLGSVEPIIFRKAGYDKSDLKEWAEREDAKIAYLQIQWREVFPRVPDEWEIAAKWRMSDNVVFGDTIFHWYSLDQDHKQTIISNLNDFLRKLPVGLLHEIEPSP